MRFDRERSERVPYDAVRVIEVEEEVEEEEEEEEGQKVEENSKNRDIYMERRQ